MNERPPINEYEEQVPKELEQAFKSYKKITREILVVSGIGETTTREGFAERRAGVRIREAFSNFIQNYPNKQELPEFIAIYNENNKKAYRIYFLPRTNEIYELSPPGRSPESDDPSFLPSSGSFLGIETVKHLIQQNQSAQRPLEGMAISSAKPDFSEEQALSEERDVYQLSQRLRNEELEIIFNNLEQTLAEPKSNGSFSKFLEQLAEIRLVEKEEQLATEEKYAELIKKNFEETINALQQNLSISLPEKIALWIEADSILEEKMIKAREKMRKTLRQQGYVFEEQGATNIERVPQVYFYTRELKMEIVPFKKANRLIGGWKEDSQAARMATPREFLANRWMVKQAFLKTIPEKIRLKLPII